jgi:hypothetical protein
MRLINTTTVTLEFFMGNNVPEYAILSHTWGSEEITFQDMANLKKVDNRKGYTKILKACAVARRDRWKYIWVDTCCINKDSSAELSEAINSMYAWYRDSQVCYVYLADVRDDRVKADSLPSTFAQSRWFTRGWTLQELLAPLTMVFYSEEWSDIGTKASLLATISEIAAIGATYLAPQHDMEIEVPAVGERMSWAANRQTTIGEDMAYCLMGLFGVNMPLLYGEGGQSAFIRLQQEIMKVSDDHSIFAWTADERGDRGLLAHSPAEFAETGYIVRFPFRECPSPPYYMTNRGLRIELPMQKLQNAGTVWWRTALNCGLPWEGAIVIYLKKNDQDDTYSRIWPFKLEYMEDTSFLKEKRTTVFVAEPSLALTHPSSGLFESESKFRVQIHTRVAKWGFTVLQTFPNNFWDRSAGGNRTLMLPTPGSRGVITFQNRSTQYKFVVFIGRHLNEVSLWCKALPDFEGRPIHVLFKRHFELLMLETDRSSCFLTRESSAFVSIRRMAAADSDVRYHTIIEIGHDSSPGGNPEASDDD